MQTARQIWMQGQLVDWDAAQVHVLTHALHYATAVFEGLRVFNTPDGPAIFRVKDHIARLFDSAKIYLMALPYTAAEIVEAIKATVRANGLSECYIRPLAYYGYGAMGVNPLPNKVQLAIAAWRWESYLGEEAERRGVRCLISSWHRIHPSAMPPQAKSTSNYANGALARIEAVKAGYDEAILLNLQGMVAEATAENVFRVKDGVLSTPPASAGVLRGVTRDTVIRIAQDLGIEFRRNDISREELYTADEVFLTGTAAGVTPVREVDGRMIGDGHWPIITKIRETYEEIVHGRNRKYWEWVEIV
jgi:branched-chain amino acid aminotransferase